VASGLPRGRCPPARSPVALVALALAAVAGCSSPSAGPEASHTAGAKPTATASQAAGTGAAAVSSSAPADPASIQEFGEQVFSLAADNSARLKLLTVIPPSLAGLKCISVYSNRGDAIAAETQESDVSQEPPLGTPTAMVAACEHGTTITQISTDNVIDMQEDTAVYDVQYPSAITTLGKENADGSDLRTTHDVPQATLLLDAAAALRHLEGLIGVSD
jgi:hypothetical protein